ncbi:hypothetical protein ACFQ60_01610 [Streptomyces zhihengii]
MAGHRAPRRPHRPPPAPRAASLRHVGRRPGVDIVGGDGRVGRAHRSWRRRVPHRTEAASGGGTRGRTVVVVNAMESEPASRKDQVLLAAAPHLVLDGAVLAAIAVGADTVHVCLPRVRAAQYRHVSDALDERRHARLDPVRLRLRPSARLRLQRVDFAGPLAQRRTRPPAGRFATCPRTRRRPPPHPCEQRRDAGPPRPHRPLRT